MGDFCTTLYHHILNGVQHNKEQPKPSCEAWQITNLTPRHDDARIDERRRPLWSVLYCMINAVARMKALFSTHSTRPLLLLIYFFCVVPKVAIVHLACCSYFQQAGALGITYHLWNSSLIGIPFSPPRSLNNRCLVYHAMFFKCAEDYYFFLW